MPTRWHNRNNNNNNNNNHVAGDGGGVFNNTKIMSITKSYVSSPGLLMENKNHELWKIILQRQIWMENI